MILTCLPMVLAGCQHTVDPSFAGQNTFGANYTLVTTSAPEAAQKATQPVGTTITNAPAAVSASGAQATPKLPDKPVAVAAQPKDDCLTGQLADGLMLVFKTFTGR